MTFHPIKSIKTGIFTKYSSTLVNFAFQLMLKHTIFCFSALVLLKASPTPSELRYKNAFKYLVESDSAIMDLFSVPALLALEPRPRLITCDSRSEKDQMIVDYIFSNEWDPDKDAGTELFKLLVNLDEERPDILEKFLLKGFPRSVNLAGYETSYLYLFAYGLKSKYVAVMYNDTEAIAGLLTPLNIAILNTSCQPDASVETILTLVQNGAALNLPDDTEFNPIYLALTSLFHCAEIFEILWRKRGTGISTATLQYAWQNYTENPKLTIPQGIQDTMAKKGISSPYAIIGVMDLSDRLEMINNFVNKRNIADACEQRKSQEITEQIEETAARAGYCQGTAYSLDGQQEVVFSRNGRIYRAKVVPKTAEYIISGEIIGSLRAKTVLSPSLPSETDEANEAKEAKEINEADSPSIDTWQWLQGFACII